jgi:hypothetical protein
MKKILLGLILCFFASNAQFQTLSENDTLLVYLTDHVPTNELYYQFLKLQFPDIHLKHIKNDVEFHQYIPEKYYEVRKKYFNNYDELGLLKEFFEISKDTTKLKPKKSYSFLIDSSERFERTSTVNYWFLDISSFKTMIFVDDNSPRAHYGGKMTIHKLELVKYDGKQFTARPITELITKDKYFNQHIEIKDIDQACYEINPITLPIYLKIYSNPDYLNTNHLKKFPCNVPETDTIFLTESLNNEMISRSVYHFKMPYQEFGKSKSLDKKFNTQVSYFKHLHLKMNKFDFSYKAWHDMQKNKFFYFYFYDFANNTFFILDINNNKIMYYESFETDKKFLYQGEKFLKKFSSFSDDC